MKSFNDPVDRLLRSAARAPEREVGDLPFALQARVLAGWRGGSVEDSGLAVLVLLRRGLALTGALALLTVALSLWQMHRNASDVWAVSDTVVNVALIQ